MTALQLPAHLQNRQSRGIAARAAEGMGSSLPPHISIQGNKFTFIDASGSEMPPMLSFDGYIVDVSDHMNKRYYDKKFDPSQNSYEPPACWSANGIGPSREATRPQAVRCDLCPQNERGSATSAMSGTAIKACRDERWLAVVNPAIGEYVFQLVVTPGSFKNWKAFIATLENYGVEPEMMLTRFQFEDKTNGVLTFTAINFTPPEHIAVIDRMLAERKSDLIVGRLDQPRTMALPAPQQGQLAVVAQGTAAQLPPNQFAPPTQNPGFGQAPQQEVIPPGAPVQAPFGAAPIAVAPQMQQAGLSAGQGGSSHSIAAPAGASPSSPAPAPQQPMQQPTQRRRRNAAPAAAPVQNAAPTAPQGGFQPSAPPQQVGGQAPFGQPPQSPGFAAGTAAPSFAPSAPTATAPGAPPAAPAGNNFGIGGGAPVDPAMSQMLGSLFGQQQQPQ